MPKRTKSIEMEAVAASPPWVILDRVTLVWHDDEENPEDTSVSLTAPPRISTVTVPTSIHPDPSAHDKHPYVIAADPDGLLLLHLYFWPFVGIDIAPNPQGIFVVVRDFLPAHASILDDPTGTAVRVPDRVQPAMPRVSNIKHVGLVSLPGSCGTDYIVAELQVVRTDRARLLYFRSGTPAWAEKDLPVPDIPDRFYYMWKFHDVISHDGKLWWVNLVWGLLSCDPFDDHPELRYKDLPETIAGKYQHWPEDIENHRCVRVSKGRLRYVEMTRARIDPIEATIVVMWMLVAGPDGLTLWWHQCEAMLDRIWESNSYRATGMPEEVPLLAVVHPSNPDVVYFFLRQYLFGVNVRESRVVEFIDEPYELIEVVAGARPPPPLSWRYVLAWELPPSLSQELEDQGVASHAEECASSATVPSPYVMAD